MYTERDPEHSKARDWFKNNAGRILSWKEIYAQGNAEHNNRLVSQAKGIYKPKGSDYALSISVRLNSSYADKEVVHRPDGSWILPYFQENNDPEMRDKEASNRGLMQCRRDQVPVGVLVQTAPKPDTKYRILGLGYVRDWENGYFFIESQPGSSTETRDDAARTRITAELDTESQTPEKVSREWQISQILKRKGQPRFRNALIHAYAGQCAITGCDAEEALEAAHISPYADTLNNATQNGLLLRADIHTLFDKGMLGIDPNTYTVVLSPALKTSSYAALNGKQIILPNKNKDLPDKKALLEHLEWAGLKPLYLTKK